MRLLDYLDGRLVGRRQLRTGFFRVLRHLATLDDTREVFSGLLREQGAACIVPELARYDSRDVPYPALRKPGGETVSQSGAVVFITARFRTGSTLLWNLFRHVPGVTAYYEPFNERRWFDPHTRGTHTDATHLQIDNYWAEYDGLEVLGKWYSSEWRFRQLYMGASAHNPSMERYIAALIARAAGRAVLQFNDVDLRLPWLRAHFPAAKLVHLYRNPRDQWCSTLHGASLPMRHLTLREFERHDGFYLLGWGRDLRHCFPFLALEPDAHPYELFYQIWKLSYLFGTLHADLSLSFEDLTGDPGRVLRWLLAELDFRQVEVSQLLRWVSPVTHGKWRLQHCDDLYDAIESRVDATFVTYQRACVGFFPQRLSRNFRELRSA